MLHKLIFKLGAAKRNPSLKKQLEFLLESDKWSYEKLEAYQLEKLKELLKFAYKYSPFYTAMFDKVGFVPDKITSVNDLKVLPVIDKKVLVEHNAEIQSRFPFKTLRESESSGTSGVSLKMYRNEEWDSGHRAALFRGYHWYGVKPWEREGYFWGYNIGAKQQRKIKFFDALVNRFRLFSYDDKSIVEFAKKLRKASFLTGYSSMIYEVAKYINKRNTQNDFHLKMVKGTSEKIFDKYQEEVKKAFGQKMISEYGACESGMIAFECPEGGYMHVVMENVVVEEIDGEIVVTNLLSKSFPIIRYKLGDYVKLAPKKFKCSCGRNHPVVLDVLGRVGKKIIGVKSSYPSLTFYYVFKNLGQKGIVLNYQAVQNEVGKITLRVEQNTQEYEPQLRKELAKYFGTDLSIDVVWNEHIHAVNGKLKDFITTID